MASFTQTLKFGKYPGSTVFTKNEFRLSCIEQPNWNYAIKAYAKVMATWQDEPMRAPAREEAAKEVFKSVMQMKTLPNSMESLTFSFLVENLPLVEVTHLLRHRTIFGVHAQCSGDRDLRDEKYYIPESIRVNDKFNQRYFELVDMCSKLYADMVDSKDVSIMDARYILPRAGSYFYYFSMNLKDIIMFIKQRRCTMIQPELDNEFARQMHRAVCSVIPDFAEVVSVDCDSSCHYVHSPDSLNTRLYKPDAIHLALLEKAGKPIPTSVYDKTREEMSNGERPEVA